MLNLDSDVGVAGVLQVSLSYSIGAFADCTDSLGLVSPDRQDLAGSRPCPPYIKHSIQLSSDSVVLFECCT